MTDVKNNERDGKREPAYPLYALDEAFIVAEAVRDLGGSRSPINKGLLAKHMKYAETGPSFVQRVAAAKAFRLIEGWGSYLLTSEAKRYFFPTTIDEKNKAELSFISSPPLFSKLIKRFDGSPLPSNEMIGNVLHHEAGIPASWKDRLASLFVRSAAFIKIIDSDNVLRYTAKVEATTEAQVEATKHDHLDLSNIAPNDPNKLDTSVWSYRQLRVETPETMSKELWEKLNAYIQILKPEQ